MAKFASLTSDAAVAQAIMEAPGWCRVGLSMRDPGMRERAAHELARAIVAGLTEVRTADPDQLPLGL